MKNYRNRRNGLVLYVLFGLLIVIGGCATSAEKARFAKVGRYENSKVGFSLEYDAGKLFRELPPAGNHVFKRYAAEDVPRLHVSVSPYPQQRKIEDLATWLAGIYPRVIPGSQVQNVKNQKMIKLSDQSDASYFEIEWSVGGRNLHSVFVMTRKNDYLISVNGTDEAGQSVEGLKAMVTTLRLDIKVDEATLRKAGFGKDGHFMRTNSPAFTLDYPREFRNLPFVFSDQIFRVQSPQGSPTFEISIVPFNPDLDTQKQLAEQADLVVKFTRDFGGTNIKVISDEIINDYEIFPARQFRIVWKFRGFSINSVYHAIAKENKIILLAGHTFSDIEELLDIFKTMNLNP